MLSNKVNDQFNSNAEVPTCRGNGRPQILCVMRMPPDLNGHGGSQRAWHLLQSLLPQGDVHFVLIFRHHDGDCVHANLDNLRPFVRSITRICIEGWKCAAGRQLLVIPPGLWNIFKMRSQEAPRLSRKDIAAIAKALPIRDPDMIFAARVCTAYILQLVIEKRLLTTRTKIVDFDDIMSKFRQRQIKEFSKMTLVKRLSARWDSRVIAQAERQLADGWHGVSVCTDDDVEYLRASHQRTAIEKIPNVIDRELLAPTPANGHFRILFVGNLSFIPNVDGLRLFLDECWSLVRQKIPNATLSVVGMHPSREVEVMCEQHRVPLHPNVPTVKDHYLQCDVVIAPILFGSGTRIKILEAMAYGRAVVSTTMGAEGMGLRDGQELLLADNMPGFAEALVRLSREPALMQTLVEAARAYQQQHFTPPAIHAGIRRLVERGVDVARIRGDGQIATAMS